MATHNKIKIFNDPIYGLISFPHAILYDLIEHRYFQRLRRISQTGMTYLVYPGAVHTRFHHALGATHLMTRAISTLQAKGTDISEAEAEAACIAILLHDIGHGPFSHALEGSIIPHDHEAVSLAFFRVLDEEFGGRLGLAIRIFTDEYERKFFHQLVSSQLDMDRMDYLSRDSFFTGVAEGIIGYDRLITMLRVVKDEIVIEEKGLYSIEKFLIARNIMYWQVYLHKTVLSAEQMLIHFWQHYLSTDGVADSTTLTPALKGFLGRSKSTDNEMITKEHLEDFSLLDDHDIYCVLKNCYDSSDFVLRMLSKGLLDRKLHKIHMSKNPPTASLVSDLTRQVSTYYGIPTSLAENVIFTGSEETETYTADRNKIKFLLRNNDVQDLSQISLLHVPRNQQVKHYLCSPIL